MEAFFCEGWYLTDGFHPGIPLVNAVLFLEVTMDHASALCFLRTSGLRVSPELVEVLCRLAFQMTYEKTREAAFYHVGIGSGTLTNSFREVSLVDRAGIKFSAEVMCGESVKSYRVEFILDGRYSETEVEELRVISLVPGARLPPAATMN